MEVVKEQSKRNIVCRKAVFNATSFFHWHDRYELCRVITPCDFMIDGEYIKADKGDIVAINDRAIHRFMPYVENTYVRILQFPIDILLKSKISADCIRPHIKYDDIKSINGLDEKVDFLFNIITDEEDTIDNDFLISIVTALYLLLMRHFPSESDASSLNKERREFYKITEYISEHFKDDIQLQDISAALYISKAKINSLFAMFTAMSPAAYIRSMRLKNVNTLLSKGYGITEAAYESGYANIRTFNYAYKRFFGYTPSEYTRMRK